MGSGGIFFDLLPQAEVLFEFGPSGVFFVHDERILGELLGGEEHGYELVIGCFVLPDSLVPLRLLLGEIA